MTDKEKLDLAIQALQDISLALGSMAMLGKMPKDDALKVFEDTCVVIGRVSEAVQAKILSQ